MIDVTIVLHSLHHTHPHASYAYNGEPFGIVGSEAIYVTINAFDWMRPAALELDAEYGKQWKT